MAGIPEFRKSQGIVPYGVGAIVDFPDDSLMAAGLDVWPQVSPNMPADQKARMIEATEIIDGRLQRRLTAMLGRRINRFLSPAEAPERRFGSAAPTAADPTKAYMPFVRFPNWHFCPRCRTLWNVPWNTPSGDERMKCNSAIRLKEGTAKTCSQLSKWQKPMLIPVRFAVACPSGHIMDFPWREWVHSETGGCGGDSGELFLVATGAAGLAGVEVRCSKCKARRTLVGAFGENPFRKVWPNGCPGHRPWLGPKASQPDCPEVPRTIQRGASNTYFAEVMNSILIPPYSQLLQQVLDRPDVRRILDSLSVIDGKLDRGPIRGIAENHGLDPEIFVKAVDERYAKGGQESSPEGLSEQEYRSAEYQAFHGPRPPRSERRDFDIITQDIGEYDPDFQNYFERIVMIPKLRETRVLTGFSRLVPPGSATVKAALSLKNQNWLPAMEVRGEGIFLVIRSSLLDEWKNGSAEINARVDKINRRLDQVARERCIASRKVTPEFILIHSLAHVLIRQLTLDSGYDSSSLRERIYVNNDGPTRMTGLLIYTASGDSEGTLGGLVRQGLPGRMEPTFRAAIANSRLCSSDPLCIESDGQGTNGLNLAACHACALLPETSCEEGNRLLDRAFLIGMPTDSKIGLFAAIPA